MTVTTVSAAMTTTVATATAEITARALFHRTSFLDYKGSAVVVGVVQSRFSCFGLVVRFEFYESKTTASASHFVGDDRCIGHAAVLGEKLFKVVSCGCPRDTTDEKFASHCLAPDIRAHLTLLLLVIKLSSLR